MNPGPVPRTTGPVVGFDDPDGIKIVLYSSTEPGASRATVHPLSGGVMSRIGKAVGHVAIGGSRSPVLALARVMTLLLVGALVAGCNSAASTSSPVTSPSMARSASSTSALGPVVGLIALGHSALTGENSDPSAPGQEVRKNSWATGTNPAVRSIYTRMLELRPKMSGQVANLAEAGAPASRLAEQARQALARVPLPALAIIQTIDDDLRCDGTDSRHVKEFGAQVESALRVITKASPMTRILMITQPGRPRSELKGMAPAINSIPKAKAVYEGPPPCGMYDNAGRLVPSDVTALTQIIEAYEAEQARVCAQFPTCSTDTGALASFRRVPSMVASDYNHLNTRGLARLAAAVWPYAKEALGKSPSVSSAGEPRDTATPRGVPVESSRRAVRGRRDLPRASRRL